MDQSPITINQQRKGGGRFSSFSDDQRNTLLKYFDEYGMTSTKRCNTELMERCCTEVGTTVDKVKNWIGSEAVKRKRKAGILPRPKFEFLSGSPELKIATLPPIKKIKRVNGYNVFFSDYVQTHSELGPDFKERNAVVAQKWAELSDNDRKQWAARAEIVCSTSIQEFQQQQGALLSSPDTLESSLLSSTTTNHVLAEENIVEKTLLAIQEKFELLEQLGFEGYSILVNTGALQTHLLATSKGKSYHKQRQQHGKPLENPFIGHVFSESSELSPSVAVTTTASTATLSHAIASSSPSQSSSPLKIVRISVGNSSPGGAISLSSLETMQRSVLNAFSLKYKVVTGCSEVPYDNLESLGVQVYGMPQGVPFHSPLLYNQQQLQQILANLEKIVFLKFNSQSTTETPLEVEISQDSVASLVDPGVH